MNLFRINDRVISANNVSLEGVDYATAVQVLRDSGQTVNLVVKRRVVLPPAAAPPPAPPTAAPVPALPAAQPSSAPPNVIKAQWTTSEFGGLLLTVTSGKQQEMGGDQTQLAVKWSTC